MSRSNSSSTLMTVALSAPRFSAEEDDRKSRINSLPVRTMAHLAKSDVRLTECYHKYFSILLIAFHVFKSCGNRADDGHLVSDGRVTQLTVLQSPNVNIALF